MVAAQVERLGALKQRWHDCLVNRMECKDRNPTLHQKILFAVAGNGSSNVARAPGREAQRGPQTSLKMGSPKAGGLTSRNRSIWVVFLPDNFQDLFDQLRPGSALVKTEANRIQLSFFNAWNYQESSESWRLEPETLAIVKDMAPGTENPWKRQRFGAWC